MAQPQVRTAAVKARPIASPRGLGQHLLFWLGPIKGMTQAKRIIDLTAWSYLACSLAGTMYYYRNGFNHAAGGDIYVVLALGLPPAFLLVGKSRLAAAVLVAISGLGAAGSFALAWLNRSGHDYTLAVVGGFWLVLCFLGGRALAAAVALKKADDALLDLNADALTPEQAPVPTAPYQPVHSAPDPWIGTVVELAGPIDGGFERIAAAQVLERLGVLPAQQTAAGEARLDALMREFGWIGPKLIWIDGVAMRGYERSARPYPSRR
jgi:hypothetical protein